MWSGVAPQSLPFPISLFSNGSRTIPPSAGGTPADNAETTRRIFAGELGPQRDLAVLNAGAAIYVAGRVDTLEAGVREAEAAVDDGRAAASLDRLVAMTQDLAPAPDDSRGLRRSASPDGERRPA